LNPLEIEIPKPLCVLREDLYDTIFYGLKNVFIEHNIKKSEE